MCNSIDCLRNRFEGCKTLDDYRLLIEACVITLSDPLDSETKKVIYDLIEKCASNCKWLLMSKEERETHSSGWDLK